MIQKIPLRNNEFSKKITSEVKYLNRCYQCSMCSDGCPVAYVMDYYPNQLIHMVKLGLKEQVLNSQTIWLCASCETCATRCPNEIDIVGLMDTLRSESRKEGVNSSVSNILKFHEAFVGQIRMKGRIDEAFLMASYELKTREFMSVPKIKELYGMAMGMLKKGKIKIPTLKRYSSKGISRIFNRIRSREH
ncbi:MAG: 4Fe-4S dicluster domain-containing protein [Dehalococcoidales bacterium]|nr:4Fe-4S dicluster domain-containing protein [Dehalococcoidales bacterium]